MNLRVSYIPEAVKEDGVVFPQELTTKEEFGNVFENLPIYEEYLDDDREEEGLEDIDQGVQVSHVSDGVLGLVSKYEVLEDPPTLEDLVDPKGEDCFKVLPSALPPMHDI